MKDMARLAQERAVNRKIAAAIHGPRRGLDRVEVPLYEWHFSPQSSELFRFHQGVFEAYSPHSPQPGLRPTNPTSFYTHHSLKVPPPDIVRADVAVGTDSIRLLRQYPPCDLWREVTNAAELESLILQRNKRHLQQASIMSLVEPMTPSCNASSPTMALAISFRTISINESPSTMPLMRRYRHGLVLYSRLHLRSPSLLLTAPSPRPSSAMHLKPFMNERVLPRQACTTLSGRPLPNMRTSPRGYLL